jgi:hypothetical protein
MPILEEVLTSNKIPPLKSIPKFKPINITAKIAAIDKIAEKEKEINFNLINLILVLSEINLNTNKFS